MGGFRRISARLLGGAALSGVALGALCATGAAAQSAPRAREQRADKEQRFVIAAGPLPAALNSWSRQTGRSIVFRSEDVAAKTARAVNGRMTGMAALAQLLEGTGFVAITGASGAVALQRRSGLAGEMDGGDDIAAAGTAAGTAAGAIPDILVTGKRTWTLNTGIQRSQDDSQPFIVVTGEEIKRSGAPNLETFLRDRLNVNAEPGVGEQASTGLGLPDGRGLSAVNLRGLGVRDTLILVDGRRQPGVNVGTGDLTQAQITGIPIASIERIEVLASSASGIYGAGASGGVINIVTRRDFSGGEITARYDNTTDF